MSGTTPLSKQHLMLFLQLLVPLFAQHEEGVHYIVYCPPPCSAMDDCLIDESVGAQLLCLGSLRVRDMYFPINRLFSNPSLGLHKGEAGSNL